MIYSTTPSPCNVAIVEHSCVRLTRNITLNPAGLLPKGTLGAVVSCGDDGAPQVVEFIINDASFVVSFEHQLDALELSEPPAGGFPKAGAQAAAAAAASEAALAAGLSQAEAKAAAKAAASEFPDIDEDDCRSQEKQHFFAFSFGHLDFVHGTEAALDCVYLGFDSKMVSANRILDAKAKSTLPANCVLMAVNYLGYMSDEEFNED